MKRHSITEWADYARGLLREEKASLMRTRLEAARSEERRTVANLERLARVAEDEGRHSPPEFAVRSVESFFRLQQPAAAERRSVLALELTFDSALAPAPAGARSLHDSTRQQLHQSEEFALDVRIDCPADTAGAIIVGQLLRRLGEPIAHVPICLVSGGEISSTAFTSEFGSFYIEGRRDPPLELRVLVDEEREIGVQLDPAPAPQA